MTTLEIVLLIGFGAVVGVASFAIYLLGRTVRQLNKELAKPVLFVGGESDVDKSEDWKPFGTYK